VKEIIKTNLLIPVGSPELYMDLGLRRVRLMVNTPINRNFPLQSRASSD